MKPLRELLEELSVCASVVASTVPWGDAKGNTVEFGPTDAALLRAFNARVPLGALLDLYQCCRSVSLAEVHNGYFIHSVEMMERDLEHRGPRETRGRFDLSIVPFGSDGSGGRFAMDVDSTDVYFLPPGLVSNGIYESDEDSFARCAASPYDLVAWLLRECRTAATDSHENFVRRTGRGEAET